MKNSLPLLLAVAMAAFVSPLVAATTDTAPAAPAPAASGKLEVGSPVPEFKPSKWIQGEPVAAFEKDKVYLIECWATWCGPCVAAIPHVNELHNKFKDKGLVVIGANVWEDPVSKAESFVKSKGEGMSYRVAFDGKGGAVAQAWLKAAGVSGIPHAFVVRENKLLWHGHPAELDEATVAAMIAGKFDATKAAEADKARQAEAEARQQKMQQFSALQRKFAAQLNESQFAEAEATLKKQEEIMATLSPQQLPALREGAALEILLAKGDKKAAVAKMRSSAELARQNPQLLQLMVNAAGKIVTDKRLAGERDYAFALECIDFVMKKDVRAAKSPALRFVRARLLQANGRVDEAKTTLAGLAEYAEKIEGWQAATDALAAGKEWPAGKLNPDAGVKVAPASAK